MTALHVLEDLQPLFKIFYTFVCKKVPGKSTRQGDIENHGKVYCTSLKHTKRHVSVPFQFLHIFFGIGSGSFGKVSRYFVPWSDHSKPDLSLNSLIVPQCSQTFSQVFKPRTETRALPRIFKPRRQKSVLHII